MNVLANILDWFAGNGLYMDLRHCMGHDYFWITVTVLLDLTVASGYIMIAKHWWTNERMLPPSPPKRALGNMRNIFIFCGLCGYLFIPIKMFWPAWRLYDIFMVFLAYFTWRYAWGARDLKVVYAELGRSTQLAADLEKHPKDAAERSFFLNAISHDLRTPLNGIVLQSSLAEMSVKNEDIETLKQSLVEMRSAAARASSLLDSFLEYAQINSHPSAPAASPCD